MAGMGVELREKVETVEVVESMTAMVAVAEAKERLFGGGVPGNEGGRVVVKNFGESLRATRAYTGGARRMREGRRPRILFRGGGRRRMAKTKAAKDYGMKKRR